MELWQDTAFSNFPSYLKFSYSPGLLVRTTLQLNNCLGKRDGWRDLLSSLEFGFWPAPWMMASSFFSLWNFHLSILGSDCTRTRDAKYDDMSEHILPGVYRDASPKHTLAFSVLWLGCPTGFTILYGSQSVRQMVMSQSSLWTAYNTNSSGCNGQGSYHEHLLIVWGVSPRRPKSTKRSKQNKIWVLIEHITQATKPNASSVRPSEATVQYLHASLERRRRRKLHALLYNIIYGHINERYWDVHYDGVSSHQHPPSQRRPPRLQGVQ